MLNDALQNLRVKLKKWCSENRGTGIEGSTVFSIFF